MKENQNYYQIHISFVYTLNTKRPRNVQNTWFKCKMLFAPHIFRESDVLFIRSEII